MVKERAFIDSSVIVSALLSSKGGSFYVLYYFKDIFEFQINDYVLDEVMDVLDRKFSNRQDLKNKLFTLIGFTPIKIFPNPLKSELKPLEKFLNKEDAPIFASALKHASYLITLDKDFLIDSAIEFAISRNLFILKPKEFIQRFRYLKFE